MLLLAVGQPAKALLPALLAVAVQGRVLGLAQPALPQVLLANLGVGRVRRVRGIGKEACVLFDTDHNVHGSRVHDVAVGGVGVSVSGAVGFELVLHLEGAVVVVRAHQAGQVRGHRHHHGRGALLRLVFLLRLPQVVRRVSHQIRLVALDAEFGLGAAVIRGRARYEEDERRGRPPRGGGGHRVLPFRPGPLGVLRVAWAGCRRSLQFLLGIHKLRWDSQ
uniref:Putative secreted protein n=1 Tax=Ixodes ricinus TaxID=34613 RepID=A0A6B0V5H6_IXORI